MTDPVQRPGWKSRFILPAAVLLVLLAAALAGTYAWYARQFPCEVEAVEAASDLLVRQLRRYDHVYQFATSASQNSIGYPVTTLQTIQMDTQQIMVPACLQQAKNELTGYMVAVIRAFHAYGAQEDEATIRDWIGQSDAHYTGFHQELEAVEQCAPVCIRQNITHILQRVRGTP